MFYQSWIILDDTKITSYGKGYLIHSKEGIVYTKESMQGNLIDVSESGKNVRRYVRIWWNVFQSIQAELDS